MKRQIFIYGVAVVLVAGLGLKAKESHAAPYVRPSPEELKPVHKKFQQVVEIFSLQKV